MLDWLVTIGAGFFGMAFGLAGLGIALVVIFIYFVVRGYREG